MNKQAKSAVIVSASSDIGAAMAQRWLKDGWQVVGSYRTQTALTTGLEAAGVGMVHCDLADRASVREACERIKDLCPQWDVLALCPGTQDPVGPFAECDFEAWETSVLVNFTRQLSIVHKLLPFRRIAELTNPTVLFFAGGGTNRETSNYSAYTISKIALIKMTGLLDAEIPDTRFVIVGPGWVKTKIHESTLKAGARAGSNYQWTKVKLAGDECTPMERVLDCCDWLIEAPRDAVSGRNFSTVYDKWGSRELVKKLIEDPNMYKLRRSGNDWGA